MAKRKFMPTSAQIGLKLGHANPKQKLFYESRALYTAYGGARGGGKSHAVRIKAVLGALHYPGIKILIIRRIYQELQKNHIEPMIKMVPSEIGQYNGALHTMYFLNGSTIQFGHWQGMASEAEYRGQEYDWIFMDEATEFSEMEFRTLGGCLRGVNEIPKRFYLTCNPGGVGHRWVKRLFIDRDFKTDSKNPEENENPNDYAPLIFATVEDNKDLMKASPAYVQMLSALPENIRRAHRYGDWDALSGAYFPEFSEKHLFDPSFKIPDSWVRYRAFDYGLDMLACYWIAVDYTGRCYVYRELKMSGLIVSDAAREILDRTLPQERISVTFAPLDIWSTQKDTGKTMAELFMQNNVAIVKASNSRVQGWLQLKELLKEMPDGKPGILFSRDCKGIIEDIQSIQADDKNPDDCAKEPHDITHSCDAIRYFAVSRSLPSQMAEEAAQDSDEDYDEDYDDFMTGGEATADYLEY
jgi:phage terminase large subunit